MKIFVAGASIALKQLQNARSRRFSESIMSRVMRKHVFGVSDEVRRKPGWKATEDDKGLEISDSWREVITLSM